MKRWTWMLLMPAALSAGCITVTTPDGKPLWSLVAAKKEAPVEKPVVKEAPPPQPVFEDQVNETNAAQTAEALRQELDYAETHATDTPTTLVSQPDAAPPGSVTPGTRVRKYQYPIR